MEYRICRLCESQDSVRGMIKYSARSYAHWACQLRRMSLGEGLAWMRSLPAHEIRNSPVLVVQDWLDVRGWTGERAMELLLGLVQAADKRGASR
jgi:hypothetical protein